MSENFLNDTLNKFAKLTELLIEAAALKESIGDETNKKDIVDKTKTLVDKLYELSNGVKEEFLTNYDKHLLKTKNKTNNGENNNSSITNGVLPTKNNNTETSSSDTNEKDPLDVIREEDDNNDDTKKPCIKVVDINKLVEKKSSLTPKEKKSVQFDASVVIITSSDDELSTNLKSNNEVYNSQTLRKSVIKRRESKRSSKKKYKNLNFDNSETHSSSKENIIISSDSSDNSSNDEDIVKRKPLKNNNKRIRNMLSRSLRNKKDILNESSLSDNSSSNSNVSSDSSSDENLLNKKTKFDNNNKKLSEENKIDQIDIETDPKFKMKPYVSLLRVSNNQIKDYYLKKKEIAEIKQLSNLHSLKRSFKNKSSSASNSSTSSSSDVDNNEVKHIKKKSKTVENKSSSSDEKAKETSSASNSSTSSSSDVDNNKEKHVKNISKTVENKSSSSDEKDKETEDNTNVLENNASIEKNCNYEIENCNNENEELSALATSVLNSLSNSDSDETDDEKKSNEEPNHLEENNSNNNENITVEDETENLETDKLIEESENANFKDGDIEDDKSENTQENEEIIPETSLDDTTRNETVTNNSEINEETSEEDKKTENNSDENERESKSENKVGKEKSNWRKDKLLTSKLSSSDSEEEFHKFSKKKDEEFMKGRFKKRMKKSRLIDSDSDSTTNKNNEDDSNTDKDKESNSSSEAEEKEKEEEEKVQEKPSTTRKRVKRIKDSSDDEDDDEKSTRKQIRRVLGRDSLAETTKQAEAEEKERKARILEKQKKYNQIFEFNELNAKVDKVVLDFDEKTNKSLLKVDKDIVKHLKPHQASGIKFMWDACFESLIRAQTTIGSGCILAHCMGLGKTLQVIALSHTLLTNDEKTKIKKVMVVCPLNTVLNWVNEYKQWLPNEDNYDIFELVSYKQNHERLYQVKEWHRCGGVLIIGYDMYRNLSNPDNKRMSKKMRTTFYEVLVNPGPDLVVCDEGHLLKNEKTNLSIAMNRLKTLRRIVLTGTPLQNNLKEYFCMVQFIKPNLLGTYKEYLNRFVNPITNGQYTDSTLHDIQVMRRRSHVLHKLLDGIVQRRDYSVLQPYLPPKHEYVLFVNLSEKQIKLYEHYMNNFARRSLDGSNRTSFLFVDFQEFQRICTHPRVLLDKSIEQKNAKDKFDDEEEESEGSLKDFINDDESTTSTNSSSSGDDGSSDKEVKVPIRKRITRATAPETIDLDEVVEAEQPKEWWQEYCDGDELDNINHSGKLFLLFQILKECEQIGDKVLVFSQSLYSLNVIEYFLGKIDEATQTGNTEKYGGHSGSWSLGLDYFRLDGSSSCDNRSAWCKTFNDPKNTRARLFLISTKAGGLGINLVAANRVIIFDVSWNPSHDVQSIYRVYRFGQTKPSYIYRFVTYGTMEMKIYERQVTKQAISKRVIDEQQIDRHYNQNDLAELYKFELPENRPIPLVPKDVLLAEMLQTYEDRIYKYHEHQSLLENKEEESLNEEERKAAWEEFENEKVQKNFNMSNGLGIPSVHILDLALRSIIKKNNPTWTDIEVNSVLPMLKKNLQDQITAGDLTLYTQIQHEIKLLQALQNNKIREQYYQQQAMRIFQQQQQMNLNPAALFPNPLNAFNQWQNMNQNGAGSSRQNITFNPNEIIDLGD